VEATIELRGRRRPAWLFAAAMVDYRGAKAGVNLWALQVCDNAALFTRAPAELD